MNYTEPIYSILSRGGFISSNSLNADIKRYYDAIEADEDSYYEYYRGIGYYLEKGNGFYFFVRKEPKVELQRKLDMAERWIDYLAFLKTFRSSFCSGLTFRKAEILTQISADMELKEMAPKLFPNNKLSHEDVVDKLLSELERMGVVELENELEGSYKVLSAFGYIEDLVDCITISEEVQDELPE